MLSLCLPDSARHDTTVAKLMNMLAIRAIICRFFLPSYLVQEILQTRLFRLVTKKLVSLRYCRHWSNVGNHVI